LKGYSGEKENSETCAQEADPEAWISIRIVRFEQAGFLLHVTCCLTTVLVDSFISIFIFQST
jgi:hypothetical protein